MRFALKAAAAVTVAGSFAFAAPARAQDTVVVQPSQPAPATNTTVVQPAPTTVAETRTEYAGPNRALIASGLLTFGITYGASAIVASTSDLSADRRLFVPVVGPWLDLAQRPDCGPALDRSCDGETTNKVLLVADGIFQGLGVLQVIGGFLMPETRQVSTTTTAKVRVVPQAGRMTGLAVIGSF
jgi:hypothetical protein